MANNRTLTLDLNKIVTTIEEKLSDNSFQNTLLEHVKMFKADQRNVVMADTYLKSPDNTIPGIGKSFEEFEENILDGTIHKIIELYFSIAVKKIDSGEVQKKIDDVLTAFLGALNTMTDTSSNTSKKNKDRRNDDNDKNNDDPNKKRK